MIEVQFGSFYPGKGKIPSMRDFAKAAHSIEDLWAQVGRSYSLYIKPDDTLFFDNLYKARRQIFGWGYREVGDNVFVCDDSLSNMVCVECAVIRRG